MKRFPHIDARLQEEIIDMLKPKIKSVLYQTHIKYREDLEQEIMLLIVTTLQNNKFQDVPTFFDLLEAETA